MDAIQRMGARVFVNSQYSADRLRCYFRERGDPAPLVRIHALGCGPLTRAAAARKVSFHKPGQAFFLVVGTIEGRKNIGTILSAWRALASRLGPEELPKLVLAGNRGWSNGETLRDIDTMTDIGGHVIEVQGLNDQEVDTLIDLAEGVICASFVEGYSLVPAEALARGCRVLLSDIPAHRELSRRAGENCWLFDPNDADALAGLAETATKKGASEVSGRFPSWPVFAAQLVAEVVSE